MGPLACAQTPLYFQLVNHCTPLLDEWGQEKHATGVCLTFSLEPAAGRRQEAEDL